MSFIKDKKFLKTMLTLALPVAFTNLLSSLVNMIDGVMAGALHNADAAVSAIHNVNQLVFFLQIIIFAVCNAATIFISQYWGKGDKDSIPPAVGFCLILGLIVTGFATVLCVFFPSAVMSVFNAEPVIHSLSAEYMRIVAISFIPNAIAIILAICLRSIRNIKVAVYTSVLSILLNTLLNYCLMFGKLGLPELGVAGAAWGTVIARFVEAAAVVISVILFKYPITAKFGKMFKVSRDFRLKFYRMLLPVFANEVFWVVGITINTIVFNQFDDGGVTVSAVGITQNLEKVLGVMTIGIGTASGVLIGNILGTADLEKVKDYAKKSLQFSVFIGVIIFVVMFGCSYFVPNMFLNLSPESKQLAASLMRVFAISQLLRGFNFMLFIGILRPGGDAFYCMVMEILTMWLIAVPVCLVSGLVFKLPADVIYLLLLTETVAKAVLAYYRYRKGKWIKVLE